MIGNRSVATKYLNRYRVNFALCSMLREIQSMIKANAANVCNDFTSAFNLRCNRFKDMFSLIQVKKKGFSRASTNINPFTPFSMFISTSSHRA